MGVKGQDLVACWGGFGSYVTRGEQRVSEMERHAMRLRERVDRLQSMLPSVMIEASIAVQKGEEPPDLLELIGEPEDLANADSKVKNKGIAKCSGTLGEPCEIRRNEKAGNEIDNDRVTCTRDDYIVCEDDEQRLCALQVLARREKKLRKEIYDMECKEEAYLKALREADKSLGSAIDGEKETTLCKVECPDGKNPVIQEDAKQATSRYGEDVRERISKLEAYSKKLCVNLKNLQKDRAELSREANILSRELTDAKEGLGAIEERVFGARSSERDIQDFEQVGLEPERNPCSSCRGNKLQDPKKSRLDSDGLKVLAGRFKEACRRAEEQGLSCSVKEPIRDVADKLKALGNIADECPCGEPVKCDSCVICSCSDWERDLEGGGDEEPEVHSHQLSLDRNERPTAERCHCGCYETSSESECPCGCRDNIQAPVCGCNYREKADCIETSSGSTTITTTTIPSSIDEVSTTEDEDGREVEYCCICSADQPCHNRCELCQCESMQKLASSTSKNQTCEMCKVVRCEADGRSKIEESCDQCACDCTTCTSRQEIPACSMCRSLLQPRSSSEEHCQNSPSDFRMKDKLDDVFDCVCPRVSDAPAEIQKVCEVDKLKEGLENLKNRNHALRKLLKSCCGSYNLNASSLAPGSFEDESCRCSALQGPVRQTTSGLIRTVKLLQSKCRTKDGMIVVLADELKRAANPAQTDRILEGLANPGLCCRASDFDCSELWKYLNLPVQSSYHGRDLDEPQQKKCYCRTEVEEEPLPPRNISVIIRIAADALLVTWKPPLSGPVAGYEILVDEEIVSRVRSAKRTEALLCGLDLRSPRLLEVRTIGPNGLHSITIEKLYDPARHL